MTIGVFFGGKNPEHDVSIITGQFIISELKKMLEYKVVPVYMGKNGEWYIDEQLGVLKFFQEKDKTETLKKFNKYFLDLEESKGKIVFKKKGFGGGEIEIDLAFPAFHGENGEDGTIQGLFEIFGIPYVGCGVMASAITMDKISTKLFYLSQNILTSPFTFFNKKDWEGNKNGILKDIISKLKWPLFVKPPRLGSSIGITKVDNEKDLEFAIEVALHYGERVLVEEGIKNLKDITCAVLGNDELTASLVQESNFGADFLNYEEKYLKDGGTQTGKSETGTIIPARVSDETAKMAQDMAKKIFKLFDCSGIARVDFLYDEKENKLYANEINTLPGTLYHHLWKASGIEFRELIVRLVKLGLEKFENKKKIQYTFESDLLTQANSAKLKIKDKGL